MSLYLPVEVFYQTELEESTDAYTKLVTTAVLPTEGANAAVAAVVY